MRNITFLLLIAVCYTKSLVAQTLNEPANWPNNNWTLTGVFDENYVYENPTTNSASFSFDDDDAQSSSNNTIAVESPIINLNSAFNAGEYWILINTNYVNREIYSEQLSSQYWDADANTWQTLDVLERTSNAPSSNYCSGNSETYTSTVLNISNFSSNQRSNFKYRFYYDDNDQWGYGFCINSPTISSEMPPPCNSVGNLTVSNVGTTTAEVSWILGSNENSWEIAIQQSGSGVPSGSGITTYTSSYNASELTDNTAYEVYVRPYCGEDGFGNWEGPVSFNTLVISRINFITNTTDVSSTGFYDLTVVDMNGDYLDDVVSVTNSSVTINYQLETGGFSVTTLPTPVADFMPTWSMAAGDIDGNGRNDLLYASGTGVAFMKASADGTSFTQMSSDEYVFSQRSNFIDINNDGNLDAFVCHDVQPNVYYLNDGNGNFTFYQGGLGDYSSGGHYGSIWIDYDNDRDMDMFIAKCGGGAERSMDQLHRNNGDGTFTEVGSETNTADPMQTWSSAWGDFDNDGDMDLFVGASSGAHKLMRNDNGVFVNVTSASNIQGSTGHENVTYDFDNDGYLDIACNGTINYGKGDLTFEDADNNQLNYKNGAFGDLNNDGFIDAYFQGTIYYNGANDNNWIKIITIGDASNLNGIGARVELHTSSKSQIRDVRSGEGFEYMSTLNTHFGLGTETEIDNVTIYWPSGVIDVIENPDVNTVLTVNEGSSLGIEDVALSDLVIHPNPVEDNLSITTTANIKGYIATVFDMSGKRVLNQRLETSTINVSQLTAGVYFLRLEFKGKEIKRKFIKQ